MGRVSQVFNLADVSFQQSLQRQEILSVLMLTVMGCSKTTYMVQKSKNRQFCHQVVAMSRDYKNWRNIVVYDESNRKVYSFNPKVQVGKGCSMNINMQYKLFQVIRTRDNLIVITELEKNCVFAYLCTNNGDRHKWSYGGNSTGLLNLPDGLCCDHHGNIIISCWFAQRSHRKAVTEWEVAMPLLWRECWIKMKNWSSLLL